MGLFDREKNKKSPETAAASPAVPENTLVPGVGRIPFPAYRGKEPYIFISYAHIDSGTVFPEIKCFNEQGYHVWYDEGIAPGNEWTEEIADALSGCSIFVVMMTPNAANSHNVRNEINYALDEKKPFVSIHLAETALRGGLKLQIGSKQAILKHNMTVNEYIYKYTSAFERLGIPMPNKLRSDVTISDAGAATKTTAPASGSVTVLSDRDSLWSSGILIKYNGNDRHIRIPDYASKISALAFQNSGIVSVDIPESVVSIDALAFEKCQDLELVTINGLHTKIEAPGPFSFCPKAKIKCHKGSFTHDCLSQIFKSDSILSFFDDGEEKDENSASGSAQQAERERYWQHEIQRIQNSQASMDDFEWIGSVVKAYHGIKKRFTIPARAVKIISYAFKNSDLIEQVTLPESVTDLYADSFYNCRNLQLVVIQNDHVRIDEPGAFTQCPKLTVQCRRNSVTHENLRKTFSGNIIFFEEAVQASPNEPDTDMRSSQVSIDPTIAAGKKHAWGDYVPKGTAHITLVDGTVREAIANSLLCCAVGIEINAGNYQRLYSGFDNPTNDIKYQLEKMVLFSDMQSVSRQNDTLAVLDYADETTIIHPVKEMSLWFIDGSDCKKFTSVAIDDLQKMTFDRTRTPDFEVSFCKIKFEDDEVFSPFAYLVFNIDLNSSGIPDMKLTTDLSPIAGFPLTLKRIKKLSVAKLIKPAAMFSPLTEAEIEVELKNGETNRFTFSRRFNIMALTGNGVLRSFGLEKLKSIEMP